MVNEIGSFEKEANKNYGKLSESFPKGSISIDDSKYLRESDILV